MIGLGLILIGIVILLETFGLLTGIPAGIVWGVVLIGIGVAIMARRAGRRSRREQWIREHHGQRHEHKQENPGGGANSKES